MATGSRRAGGWDELAITADALPSVDAPWARAAAKTFPGENWTVLFEEGGECQGVAPLVRRGALVELAGSRELGEPADLLARSPEALTRLAEGIANGGRTLVLHRLPSDSPTLTTLQEVYGRRAWLSVKEGVGYPTIELDERWSEPGGGLSSSRRSALRRSRRRAERGGAVEAELLSPAPEEVEGLLDEAFAIEARSWKGEQGTALVQVPVMEAFFRRYAAELADRGTLRIDFLKIDGRRVAMQLGLNWNRRHWLFKIGYDAAHREVSPGQLLLAESVAAAAQAGLEAYELLGSRDTWTDAWTELVHPCSKVVVTPRSGRGIVGAGSRRRGEARRDIDRRVRHAKRSLIDRTKQRYVAGPELTDALAAVRRYAAHGYATSVGFWNGRADSAGCVVEQAMTSAASLEQGGEVSIKLLPFGGDGPPLDELMGLCDERGLRLHLDALQFETADLTREAALRLEGSFPGAIGCTLPGRWGRSVDDAAALRERRVCVRVVKGEVPAPDGAGLDLGPGFLDAVEALAGGSCFVEVATHDAKLAKASLEMLREQGSECELQVLHGGNGAASARVARALGVPVRVYIPFGTGRLPYDGDAVRGNPWLALTLARDVLPSRPRQPLLGSKALRSVRSLLPPF